MVTRIKGFANSARGHATSLFVNNGDLLHLKMSLNFKHDL